MFILSQCVLHKYNFSKLETITTYSIALGLVIYSCVYLYVLFYNTESISIFNKFIIYIVGIDLLLSTFYYNMNKIKSEEINTPLLHENVEETLSNSDSDSDSVDLFESIYDENEELVDLDLEIENEIENENICFTEPKQQEPEQEPKQEPEQ